MTNPPPPSAIGRESELLEHYAAVKARLMGGSAPALVQRNTPPPVSPFVRAMREKEQRRKEAREQMKYAPMWLRILNEVAEKHGVGVRDIRSSDKTLPIMRARREACWRMRHEITVNGGPMSFPEIGRRIGVDSSSVINAVKKYEAARHAD